MLNAIFGFLGEGVGAIGTWLTSMFSSIIALIYIKPVAPATVGSLTEFGQLLFIGMIVGLFFFILRWVISLIRFRVSGAK